MDQIDTLLLDAWNRIGARARRNRIVARNRSRRRFGILARPMRAWSLCIRASDTRISPYSATIEINPDVELGLDESTESAFAPPRGASHTVTLDGKLIRELTRPVTIPWPGVSYAKAAKLLGRDYQTLAYWAYTQVLGARRAQELAKRFRLTGRVDLYHAFVTAMMSVLKESGILGLLTSNRFMLIQSGAVVRSLFGSHFDLHEVYDLGDTKLFEAAVLPAIVIAERRRNGFRKSVCSFVRVYEVRGSHANDVPTERVKSPLAAIACGKSGEVTTITAKYRIDRGTLMVPTNPSLPWSLMSLETRAWIETVHRHRHTTFDQIARIRVGIKTTADNVFSRDDWHSMPDDERPESDMLHPLITHDVAQRWTISEQLNRHVLYPHESDAAGNKRAVDLKRYPKARQYLEAHRAQLESRSYRFLSQADLAKLAE